MTAGSVGPALRNCRSCARKFADAQTQEERKQLAERMQIVTHDLVSYVPLGQSFPSQGIATNLEGYIESPVPFFWNLKRK